ncbi:hypothetical protein E4U56_004677 [Claviceps arundinis]|uniref:Uncharacterized protein n=1 Tax=Claviceps arundinis TaxID=1623583 RepID=A0A9P7MN57_9HYPO|nr:hypothetical protein E4U56_004677 [Claviceps arundinis]
MLLWRKKVAGIARVKTAWVEQKARVGRTAKQVDSKSSPPEKSVPSSTHLLRLVADALDLQAEDLKPWTEFESLGNETDVELAAAFFSDNLTVAAARETLNGSPEPNIVEKSPPSETMSRASSPLATASTAQPEMRSLSRQNKIEKDIS